MEEVEVHKKVNGDPEYSGPKGPLKPTINGASIKPRLAILRSNLSPRSSPTPGPLLKGGGKKGRGRTRDSRGSVRTLEKWLLPLGSLSGHPGLKDMDREDEDKARLEAQGGGQNEV